MIVPIKYPDILLAKLKVYNYMICSLLTMSKSYKKI